MLTAARIVIPGRTLTGLTAPRAGGPPIRLRPPPRFGGMTQHLLALLLAIWGVLPQIAIGSLLALWLTKA